MTTETSGITIASATIEDRPAIAELTRRSYSHYGLDSDPDWWKRYEQLTRDTLLFEERAERVVALQGNQLVGSVLLCPPYEWELDGKTICNPYPEMRLLAVSAEFRDRGIGGLLIADCERRTANGGFDSITLHTTELMQTAKSMYERRGYKRYPRIDFQPVPGFIVWGYRKEFVPTVECQS